MRPGLQPGDVTTFRFALPPTKTVRHLYPEAEEFQSFPEVFATGFMVGLMEWTCVKALAPFLEPGEGSLGTSIEVSHDAATPPGFEVAVTATVMSVEGRRVRFEVAAHDGVDTIGKGRHERAVIVTQKFADRLAEKTARRPRKRP